MQEINRLLSCMRHRRRFAVRPRKVWLFLGHGHQEERHFDFVVDSTRVDMDTADISKVERVYWGQDTPQRTELHKFRKLDAQHVFPSCDAPMMIPPNFGFFNLRRDMEPFIPYIHCVDKTKHIELFDWTHGE
jgi:hypothetical protein